MFFVTMCDVVRWCTMSDVPLLNTTVMSLYSKYVKNCNIFGQILNIWVKLILKKKFNFFFQCLALPKDSQSFGILMGRQK